jgi:bifunctional UDP-N-acetylglucosamine pyrophosphorylase/glucosamine-1-phosphate N-acetyltransferase
MQAVILAAGRGKRMGDLTKSATKPMLKIKGKPILEHKIKALPRRIKEIIFVVGYHSSDIVSHFKRYFDGRRIIYVFQTNLNGTGGALDLTKSVLRDKFLVIYGDDLYTKKDIQKMLKHDLAVLAKEVDDPSKFGIVKKNRKGHVVDIIEKPKRSKDNLAAAGVFALNKNFFNYDLVSIGGGEYGLPQTLVQMARDHKIKVEKADFWHPIGNPDDLKSAGEVLHKFL